MLVLPVSPGGGGWGWDEWPQVGQRPSWRALRRQISGGPRIQRGGRKSAREHRCSAALFLRRSFLGPLPDWGYLDKSFHPQLWWDPSSRSSSKFPPYCGRSGSRDSPLHIHLHLKQETKGPLSVQPPGFLGVIKGHDNGCRKTIAHRGQCIESNVTEKCSKRHKIETLNKN